MIGLVKEPTPRDRLMTHANDNPRQMLVVSEANGVLKMDFSYISPGDAVFMLHALRTRIESEVNDKIFMPPPEVKP